MADFMIVSFVNEKGGVGKSTLSVSTAAILAWLGYRVVYMDGDPQGNGTRFFGLSKLPHFWKFLTQAQDKIKPGELVRPVEAAHFVPAKSTSTGRLSVIGGDVSSRNLPAAFKLGAVSLEVFRERVGWMAGGTDIVIVDTPPTPSDLIEAILKGSTRVVIPTDCEYFSGFEGVPETKSHADAAATLAENEGFTASQIIGIIPNRFEKSSPVHKGVLAALKNTYGDLVWNEIPKTETIRQAHSLHKSVHVLYPRTAVTKQLIEYAERIIAR